MAGSALLWTPDARATEELGASLAPFVRAGDVLGLSGEVGAGKTTLVRGLALGLDVEDDVTSPTFALLHVYAGRLPLHHVDLYRLSSEQELWDMDFDLLFPEQGCAVVEWADRFSEALPPLDAAFELRHDRQEGREILATFFRDHDRWARAAQELQKWAKRV